MVRFNQNVEDPRPATPMAHQWHGLMFTVEDLPGIGRRYGLQGQHGGRVSVVIHRRTGQRELYAYGADDCDRTLPPVSSACPTRRPEASDPSSAVPAPNGWSYPEVRDPAATSQRHAG